jgi:hypothetical protein
MNLAITGTNDTQTLFRHAEITPPVMALTLGCNVTSESSVTLALPAQDI